jgi:hypothetical protein
LITNDRGVFIAVQGGVTDLVKLITRQVVADRPSHMAQWPRGPTSTDFLLRIPCYRLLESVTVKPTRERLQSGTGQPATPWTHWSKQPLHTAFSYKVHSQGDTYFDGILNFLLIS